MNERLTRLLEILERFNTYRVITFTVVPFVCGVFLFSMQAYWRRQARRMGLRRVEKVNCEMETRHASAEELILAADGFERRQTGNRWITLVAIGILVVIVGSVMMILFGRDPLRFFWIFPAFAGLYILQTLATLPTMLASRPVRGREIADGAEVTCPECGQPLEQCQCGQGGVGQSAQS